MKQMKPILAAGLDAGSKSTRCIISLVENGRLRLLGYGEAPSQGWVKGRISDQPAASSSILAAVKQAEEMAGVEIGSVTAGVGGLETRGTNTRGAAESGDLRELSQTDVRRAVERAKTITLAEGRLLLQALPQDFIVDGHPGFRSPRGLMGSQIEANLHLITTSEPDHQALVGAINNAHLAVEDTVYEGFAACYSTVFPEERRGGIALIDIGEDSTEMVVYDGDTLLLAAPIRVYGARFTSDLVKQFTITPADAELVRTQFGCVDWKSTPRNSFIEMPVSGSQEVRSIEIERYRLNYALEARAADLFVQVSDELDRIGMANSLGNGIVLTGGGARLDGMWGCAERILKCRARVGIPKDFLQWPNDLNDPAWAVAAGLSMYSARLQQRAAEERANAGWVGMLTRP